MSAATAKETSKSALQRFSRYDLSAFQQETLDSILRGEDTFVSAPTGSGKTLPAEMLIAVRNAAESRQKVVYTTPIKALTNQKVRDLRTRFPEISFGLLTGDCKDNPDAQVLVMTTEILRNTLMRDSSAEEAPIAVGLDIQNDLGAVIFDEVHYITDPERGGTWEQTIALLPSSVQILMLSATLDGHDRLARWVETRRADSNKVNIAGTTQRSVPLTHYMWTYASPSTTSDERDASVRDKIERNTNRLVEIMDDSGKVHEPAIHAASWTNRTMYRLGKTFKPKTVVESLITELHDKDLLPAICFSFSRKQCDSFASGLSLRLHDDDGRTASNIDKICRGILSAKVCNVERYTSLPEYQALVQQLEKGVAAHHAGMIPILRELVEIMFELGHVKVLFATETFAIGINMPTRTVVFTGVQKYDGSHRRPLHPYEYTQMAGRAGRRGLDARGVVVHCANLIHIPEASEYRQMMCGSSRKLESRLHVTCGLLLNVMAMGTNRPTDINTFIENTLMHQEIRDDERRLENTVKTLQEQVDYSTEALEHVTTPIAAMDEYQSLTSQLSNARNKKRKEFQRKIALCFDANPRMKKDLVVYDKHKDLVQRLGQAERAAEAGAMSYIDDHVARLVAFLVAAGFLNKHDDGQYLPTLRATVASHVNELSPLAAGILVVHTVGFQDQGPCEIAGLLACLVPSSLPEHKRLSRPATPSSALNALTVDVQRSLEAASGIGSAGGLMVDTSFDIVFDWQVPVMAWCAASSDDECNEVLKIVHGSGLTTGEFSKVVLRVAGAVRELIGAGDTIRDPGFSSKLHELLPLLYKHVVEPISLYI